jgi:hypothetical protein
MDINKIKSIINKIIHYILKIECLLCPISQGGIGLHVKLN